MAVYNGSHRTTGMEVIEKVTERERRIRKERNLEITVLCETLSKVLYISSPIAKYSPKQRRAEDQISERSERKSPVERSLQKLN